MRKISRLIFATVALPIVALGCEQGMSSDGQTRETKIGTGTSATPSRDTNAGFHEGGTGEGRTEGVDTVK